MARKNPGTCMVNKHEMANKLTVIAAQVRLEMNILKISKPVRSLASLEHTLRIFISRLSLFLSLSLKLLYRRKISISP